MQTFQSQFTTDVLELKFYRSSTRREPHNLQVSSVDIIPQNCINRCTGPSPRSAVLHMPQFCVGDNPVQNCKFCCFYVVILRNNCTLTSFALVELWLKNRDWCYFVTACSMNTLVLHDVHFRLADSLVWASTEWMSAFISDYTDVAVLSGQTSSDDEWLAWFRR